MGEKPMNKAVFSFVELKIFLEVIHDHTLIIHSKV